jgi:ComEC/Rec2-related protein
MSAKVISNAKLTVLAAVLAATGAILNSTGAPLIVAVLCSVAFFAGLYYLSASKHLSSVLLMALLSCMPMAYFEYAQQRQSKPASNDLVNFAGREVIFIGTANRDECVASGRELTLCPNELVFPKKQLLSGKTLLTLRNPQVALAQVSNSDSKLIHLRIRGSIYAPRVNPQPWEYDKRKKLAAAGICSICYLGRNDPSSPAIQIIGGAPEQPTKANQHESLLVPCELLAAQYENLMTSGRRLIVETHRKYLPTKLADLLSSMVLGNRAVQLKEEMTYKFRDVGLSHILAASGFNLTIVTAMSFALCRFASPSVVLANIICFLSMLGFVSLAGPSPSVLRAALMCTIMLITRCGQRRMLVSSALAAAFLVTVTVDPLCTNDLGLQLSYAATVGIVIGTNALSAYLYPGLSKWKRSIADAFSVVVVAQVSVMPIQLYFFWKTGTMFIPANLLVTPLVTPMTIIGFASSTLALLNASQSAVQAFVGYIIALADAVAFVPLTIMLLMVNMLSSWEAAKFSLGPPTVACVVFYYLTLILFFISLRIHKRVRWTTALFSLAICLLLWRPTPPLLTVASLHKQLILINAEHQAINITSDKVSDKMIERFLAFNGAKLAPNVFRYVQLPSTLCYVQSANWLVILSNPKSGIAIPEQYNKFEIESLVSKVKCNRVIFLTAKYSARTDLPHLPGFEPCDQSRESQVKIIGLRDVDWVMLCRIPNNP